MSRLESDYYAFMGFDSAHSAVGLRHYTQFFPAGTVLELACGRGEFLELLAKAGVAAEGVDIDEGMVATARERGMTVHLGDAIADLEGRSPDSLAGVFAAHFLEHLTPADVARVADGAGRALRPGGRLVVAVPNAACQSVQAYDFWRDPTHVRFYDPGLLAFFFAQAGLSVVDSGGNPDNNPGPPPETLPGPVAVDDALDDGIAKVVQFAVDPTASGTATGDPTWPAVGHLLTTLAQRLRHTQHELADLHLAHRQLLTRLWPANEVYVVAEKPDPAAGP